MVKPVDAFSQNMQFLPVNTRPTFGTICQQWQPGPSSQWQPVRSRFPPNPTLPDSVDLLLFHQGHPRRYAKFIHE